MSALIILNEKVDDMMKIVKSLGESGLLIKGVSETIANKTKDQKFAFLDMLMGKIVYQQVYSQIY